MIRRYWPLLAIAALLVASWANAIYTLWCAR